MSSTAAISTVPTVDAGPTHNGKAPVAIDVTPKPATIVDVEQSPATKLVEPRSEFELEEHPIDIPPKIKVSQPMTQSSL